MFWRAHEKPTVIITNMQNHCEKCEACDALVFVSPLTAAECAKNISSHLNTTLFALIFNQEATYDPTAAPFSSASQPASRLVASFCG